MEGMGVKLMPSIGDIYYTIQTCLGLWLVILGPIASPNGPKRGFNPPPASHPLLPLPTHSFPLPPTHLPTPYNVPSVILQ